MPSFLACGAEPVEPLLARRSEREAQEAGGVCQREAFESVAGGGDEGEGVGPHGYRRGHEGDGAEGWFVFGGGSLFPSPGVQGAGADPGLGAAWAWVAPARKAARAMASLACFCSGLKALGKGLAPCGEIRSGRGPCHDGARRVSTSGRTQAALLWTTQPTFLSSKSEGKKSSCGQGRTWTAHTSL